MHELLHREYVAIASTSFGQRFDEEIGHAQDEYGKFGRLHIPWLKWAPDRTLADVVREYQERHKDPAYRAAIRKIQDELDTDATRIKNAVEEEMALRKQAQEHRVRQRDAAKRPIGRRYVRVPSRRRSLV